MKISGRLKSKVKNLPEEAPERSSLEQDPFSASFICEDATDSGLSILAAPICSRDDMSDEGGAHGNDDSHSSLVSDVRDLFSFAPAATKAPSTSPSPSPAPAPASSSLHFDEAPSKIQLSGGHGLASSRPPLRVDTFAAALRPNRGLVVGLGSSGSGNGSGVVLRRLNSRSNDCIWKSQAQLQQPLSTSSIDTGSSIASINSAGLTPPAAHDGSVSKKSLFRSSSDKALAIHRARWEDLAHGIRVQQLEQQQKEKEEREQVDNLTSPGPPVGWVFATPASTPYTAAELLSFDDGEVLTASTADSSVGVSRPRSLSESGMAFVSSDTHDPLELEEGDLEQQQQQQQQQLMLKFWAAIASGDHALLRNMTDKEDPEYIRNWHVQRYTAASPASSSPASPDAAGGECKVDAPATVPPVAMDAAYLEMSALHIVARRGLDHCLKVVLNSYPRHGSVDLRDRRNKCPPALYAAHSGNLECVKLLHMAGAILDCKDRSGENILHKAVRADSAEIVSWLLRKEPNIKVNLRNRNMNTPLLLARSRDVAMILIRAGADPTLCNANKLDIACLAAIRGDEELLETVLLANTAFQRHTYGQPQPKPTDFVELDTVLKVSPRASSGGRSRSGSLTSPKSGSRPRSGSWGQQQSSSKATKARSGSFDMGSSPRDKATQWPHMSDVRDLHLKSPLHLAVYHGNSACVQCLCRIFKDTYSNISSVEDNVQRVITRDTVNTLDYHDWKTGWTPLQLACIYGHVDVVLELLQFGASPLEEDRQGCIAVVLAAYYGHFDCMRVLEGSDYINSRGESTLDNYLRLKMHRHHDIKDWLPYIDNTEAYILAFPSYKDPHLAQSYALPPPPSRRNDTPAEREVRESHLLRLLIEDKGFMGLLALGAHITDSFAKLIASPDTYEQLLSRLNTAVNVTGNSDATVGERGEFDSNSNPTSVSSTMENSWFLQQDRRFCDVTILCRANTNSGEGDGDDAKNSNSDAEAEDTEYATTDGDISDATPTDAMQGKKVIYAHQKVLTEFSTKLGGHVQFVKQQLQEEEVSAKRLLLQLDDLDYSRGCQMVYYMYTRQLVENAEHKVEARRTGWSSRSRAASFTSADADADADNVVRVGGVEVDSGTGEAAVEEVLVELEKSTDDAKLKQSEAEAEAEAEAVVVQSEQEPDVAWLINLLPVADEYIMPHLMEVVIDELIRAVTRHPRLAPLVLINCIDMLEILETRVLRGVCARQVLLQHVQNRHFYGWSESSAMELLEIALSTLVTTE